MFNNQGSQDTPTQPQGPPREIPIPTMREFAVRVWDVTDPGDKGTVETLKVLAHGVQHTSTGALVFIDYVNDPIESPTQRQRLGLNDWIDFKEVL